MPAEDQSKVRKTFSEAVNMTPSELEHWLKAAQSQDVGFHRDGADESVGHAAGRRIVAIKRKRVADLTFADYQHMTKVIGYVHRHLAQRPKGDVSETRWRRALMNWGHDPLKR
jgi:hypothetical protein